jgi:hypothetical protein
MPPCLIHIDETIGSTIVTRTSEVGWDLTEQEGKRDKREAPAGGVMAATQEGGALASPSASPHLSVVGVGNHVSVLVWTR